MRLTDRQTDGRTDRRTEFSSLDRVCISCSEVKIRDMLLETGISCEPYASLTSVFTVLPDHYTFMRWAVKLCAICCLVTRHAESFLFTDSCVFIAFVGLQ